MSIGEQIIASCKRLLFFLACLTIDAQKLWSGKQLTKKNKNQIFICVIAALLFIGLVLGIYAAAGSHAPWEHSFYDSFTLQAMAWRKGEAKLSQNYPYLELAIVNKEYFANHSMDDYEAYREKFGDINAPIEDQEGNEYYVSFPPFPSVPMFLLSFFFGEDTPSTMMSILYTAGAFLFAILIGRRLQYSYTVSIVGAAFLCIASSALFICTNKMAGGVWFQAQALALLLTTGAFYFILGGRDRDYYTACILLACAVGCRPFQLIYFIPCAYIMAKQYDFKILKTWKFYVAPAIIGGIYMWYNYIRFGNPLEFGHNYLPEFMRMPDGQFGWAYFGQNFANAFGEIPHFTAEGLSFNQFGFAFYIANVIFILAVVSMVFRIGIPSRRPSSRLRTRLTDSYTPEMWILIACITAHLLFLLLHKTLGGWQFGSRYTVDMAPATLVLIELAVQPLFVTHRKGQKPPGKKLRLAFSIIAGILLVFGGILNLYGAVKMF